MSIHRTLISYMSVTDTPIDEPMPGYSLAECISLLRHACDTLSVVETKPIPNGESVICQGILAAMQLGWIGGYNQALTTR